VKGICKTSATTSKIPNVRIMGIKEEEMQAKGIWNKFNKIMEKFPNLEKELTIQV
jgi:hypothetical protein